MMRLLTEGSVTHPRPHFAAAAAAAAAVCFPLMELGPLLGLEEGHWHSPWWRSAFLLLVFSGSAVGSLVWSGITTRRRWTITVILFLTGGATVAATPGLLSWLQREGLLLANEAVTWARSFWYGVAEPPSQSTGLLLYTALAWLLSGRLWRVAAGRASYLPWLIIGSIPAVVLWLYDRAPAAIVSHVGYFSCMLVLAALSSRPLPRYSTPAPAGGGTADGGRWVRLAAAGIMLTVITPTALALPIREANPWPAVHQEIQRLLPMSARGAKSGFGDYTQISNEINRLPLGGPFRPSETDLLELTVTASEDAALPPVLYLRGIVHTDYTGTAFTGRQPVRLARPATQRLQTGMSKPTVRQRIQLIDFNTSVLYSAQHPRQITLPPGKSIFRDRDEALRVDDGLHPGDVYEVVSDLPKDGESTLTHNPGSWSDLGDAKIAESYMTLPETLPQRVLELSHDLSKSAPTPYQAARQITSYLRQHPYQPDTPYTPPGRDFVDYFLFDLKSGYCVYYASAAVVLLRGAGIPARLVEGLIVPLQGEGTYRVSAQQAHTWVEAYFPGYGWHPLEPTPANPETNLLPVTPEMAGDPGLTGEEFLEYELGTSADPLFDENPADEAAPDDLISTPEQLQLKTGPGPVLNWQDVVTLIPLLLNALAAATVLTLIFRKLRRWHRRLTDPRFAVAEIYERSRSLLARTATMDARPEAQLFATHPRSLTPEELARRAAALWPALSLPLLELAEAYNQAAYARTSPQVARVDCAELNRRILAALKDSVGAPSYLWIRFTSIFTTQRFSIGT